jgi:competence protein ComEC
MSCPLIGLFLCYGFGIFTGTISDFHFRFPFSILVVTYAAAGVSLLREKSVLSSVFLYLCLFLLGISVIQYHLEDPSRIRSIVSRSGDVVGLKRVIVSKPEAGRENPALRLALILKREMEGVIRESMDPPQSFFLESVLLGNRHLLPRKWKRVFSETGTAHLISISGLHVGFVLTIFLLVFRVLNLPSRAASILTVALIILYCLLTGARPPTVRASIMAIMILAGFLLNRPVHAWNSLAVAAFIIVILNPTALFNPGFQMSFAAVAGILYIHPRLQRLWSPAAGWLRWIWKAATVSIGAQFAVLPIAVCYFNILPLVTLPVNLIVVPILGLIVSLGFCACISGFVWIGFAHLFNAANWLAITVLFWIVRFFNSVPGSCVRVPSPPVYLIPVYYLAVLAVLKVLEGHAEMGSSYFSCRRRTDDLKY